MAVASILMMQAAFLAVAATKHSPTALEPALLASGISHWQLGDFQLYRVNPPLPRMVAAIPVLVVGCETDWRRMREWPGSRAEYPVGEDFISANGPRAIPLVIYSRWACIPFALLGGWVAYRWAGELYGKPAGILALVLLAFEPNLLAHAELVTPDCACWSCGIVAGYTFWRWLKAPSWISACLAGVTLGVAELTKLTWVILFGLWPLLWVTWLILGSRQRSAESGPGGHCPSCWQLVGLLALATFVLNLGYGFDAFGTPLKDFKFVSQPLTGNAVAGEIGNRFQGSWIGEVPLPLPAQYVLGCDTQARDLADYRRPSFLFGEWKDGGWWHYYLFGLLVKVPCGIWLLFFVVVIARAVQRCRPVDFRDELVLLAPAVVVLVLCSSQTEINEHLRYAYPSLAFTLIWLGQATMLSIPAAGTVAAQRSLAQRNLKTVAVRTVVGTLVAYSVISMLLVYPHHLAYFNDFVGGPNQGWKYLRGSSFDWGQDLLEVARFEAASGETFNYPANTSQIITLEAARQYVIGHRQQRSSSVVLTVSDQEFGTTLMQAHAIKIARTHVIVPGNAGALQVKETRSQPSGRRTTAAAVGARPGLICPLVMSVPAPF